METGQVFSDIPLLTAGLFIEGRIVELECVFLKYGYDHAFFI